MRYNRKEQITGHIARHKKAWMIAFAAALMFFSCCVFPLAKHTKDNTLEIINTAMFIVAFVELGSFLPYLNVAGGHTLKNALYCLGAIVLGLLCRYGIEFGEVSNVYNFTFANVASFTVGALILLMGSFVYGKRMGK